VKSSGVSRIGGRLGDEGSEVEGEAGIVIALGIQVNEYRGAPFRRSPPAMR
jgi:hypothetical protein